MKSASNEALDSRLRGNERSVGPAFESQFASQAAFRALMDCIARPGEIRTLEGAGGPAPLAPATAALIRSLADYESPVWLDQSLAKVPSVADWIRFQTGAPIVAEPGRAVFALVGNALGLPDFSQFAQGTEEYPDRSATLIVQIRRFGGHEFTIDGPGLRAPRAFAATPLPDDFVPRMRANRELFPRGVDLVFVAGNEIAALPRSVRITQER